MFWLAVVVTVMTGYLLGNINGAVSISVLFNDDVRTHGSGNAGLTNFVRNFGYTKAGFVILIDVFKAVLACFVGYLIMDGFGWERTSGMMLGAIGVSLGHDYPALLGFRGGKGILSGLAIAATIDWRCALVILAVFVICVALTKFVSLGSLLGALSFAVFFGVMYTDQPVVMLGGIFLGLMAVFMHRGNIVRLLNGTERKFSFKREK